MADPGTLASQLPKGDDYLVRKVQDLERALAEGLASVAQSFQTTVASIVRPVVTHAEAHGFALPYSDDSVTPVVPMTVLTSATVEVPPECTQALVLATSELSCYNGTPGPGSIYLETLIAGMVSTTGHAMSSSATNAWYAFASKTNVQVLTGLSESFTITTMGGADSTWPTNDYNLVNLNASILFLP